MPDPSAPDPTSAGSRSPLFRHFLIELEAGREPDIEEWCAHHPGQADTLLAEHSAWQADQSLIGDLGFSADVDDVELVPQRRKPSEFERGLLERLGPREAAFGRYRIGDEIGHGGMGTVYEVFDEDLRRTLAMKVIRRRRGARSLRDEELSRFVDEAQVSGQLQHPGIVPVHDLGLDDQGQLFFTMKLVQGVTLAEVFRLRAEGSAEWSDARVLGVLLRVCEAVAYAHDQGVVHRDLKPSNVMVGDFGEVYVLDWGLAMLADDDTATGAVRTDRADERASSSDSPSRTAPGRALGTALYCAPEQARGERDAIGPRSDVYSIGAMLYELLLERPPYIDKGERPDRATVLERVRTGEPDPATRLSAARPAELAAIGERAMAREPEARFEDVEGLAEELRAFVEGRVVRSFESGAWARLRKWVRRNRALSASMLAAGTFLAVGLATSLTLYAKESRSRQRIQEERNRLQNVVDFQDGIFGGLAADSLGTRFRLAVFKRAAAELERQGLDEDAQRAAEASLTADLAPVNFTDLGADLIAGEILDPAYERALADYGDDPETWSALQAMLGDSYHALGLHERALELRRTSLELRRSHFGDKDSRTLESVNSLASSLEELGAYEEALALREEDVGTSSHVLGEDHPETRTSRNNLCYLLNKMGEHERALELLRPLLATAPGRGRVRHTISVLSNTASALDSLSHYEESLELYQEALRLCRQNLEADDPLTLGQLNNVGFLLQRLDRGDDALPYYRETYELKRTKFGDEHPETISSLTNLGRWLDVAGRPREAEPLLREAVAAGRRSLGPDHPGTLTYISNLAVFLGRYERLDESGPMVRACLERRRAVLPAGHPDIQSSVGSLAAHLARVGRFEEAEALQRELLAGYRERFGDRHENTITALDSLAVMLDRREKNEEALEAYEKSLRLSEELRGIDHNATLITHNNLGQFLMRQGDLDGAREHLEFAKEARLRKFGLEHAETLHSIAQLGSLEIEDGNPEEALRLYFQTLDVAPRILSLDDPQLAMYYSNALYICRLLERFQEARDLSTRQYELLASDGTALQKSAEQALELLVEARLKLPASEDDLPYFREAYELGRARAGAGSDDAFERGLDLLGRLTDLRLFDEALSIVDEVLEASSLMRGETHEDTIWLMASRGYVLLALDRPVDASTQLELASELAEQHLEDGDSTLDFVRSALDKLYRQLDAEAASDD